MIEHEKHPCLQVVAMSADAAREFFEMPNAYVEDGGPPDRPERHKEGARTWHVYPRGKYGQE